MPSYFIASFDSDIKARRCQIEIREHVELGEAAARLASGIGPDTLDGPVSCAVFDVHLAVRSDDGIGISRDIYDLTKLLGGTIWLESAETPFFTVLVKRQSDDAIDVDDLHALLDHNMRGGTVFRRRSTFCGDGVLILDEMANLYSLLDSKRLEYRVSFERKNWGRFQGVAYARCPECDSGRLDFLAREFFDVPDDQFACQTCGGMFAMETARE